MKSSHKFILFFLVGSSFALNWQSKAQCPGPGQPGLAISSIQTDVSCFGGTDGTITLTIVPGVASGVAQAPYSIQLYYFSSGFTLLASLSGVSGTTFTFKQGDGSLNQIGADAFGIPANAAGEFYRIDVQSTGGSFICRNKTLLTTINEPNALLITTNSLTPDCDPVTGGIHAIGAIDLSISGGTGSYAVSWPTTPPSTPISSSSVANGGNLTASNLDGGSYTISVTDVNNCNLTQVISLPISTLPNAGSDIPLCSVTSTSLNGNSPGPSETGAWTGPAGVTFSPNATVPTATASNLSAGVNTLTWTITTTGCTGNSDQVDVTVNTLPAPPTGTDVTVCFDGSAHTGSATAGAGETIVWYTAASAGSVTVAPSGTAVGVYTAFAASKNTTTNCESSTRTQVTVTIEALPAPPTGTDVTVCFDGSAHTGSATAGAGETIVWYTAASAGSVTVAPSGTAVGVYTAFAASKNTTTNCESSTRTQVMVTIEALPAPPTGTDVTVCFDGSAHTGSATAGAGETIVWYTAASAGSVTVAPSGTAVGVYTAFAASKNTTTNCESSTRTQVTVTIEALPAPPTGTDVTVCFDGSAHTGSATAGAGETIVWYTAASAGSVTVAPSGTAVGVYTAFAASKNTTTNCESSTRTQVMVTIEALPAPPTGTDVTVCFDGSAHTGSATAGAGETIVWYTAASAGSVTVAPSGTAVGVYTAFAASKNTTTNCESSTRTQVTVTIEALPAPPTGTDVTVCFDGSAHTGSATAGAGETIVWYTAASAGSVTVAPSGTAVGVYTAFAASKNTTTNCESSTRTQVTVTIEALPAPPTGTDVTVCFDGSAHTGSATAGAGETIVWYTAASAGSVTVAPSGTAVGVYTAFAASKNTTTNCESSTRTQVTVTIEALPAPPTGTDVTVCFDGSAHTGSATAGAGETIVWYTAASAGSVTVAPSGTAVGVYTAFAASKNTTTNCESSTRTQVTVTIEALPTATISYPGTPFCAAIGTASATQTGQAGGTYSSTAGLVINSGTGQIDLANSTPGPYTVTYSFTDGTCPNTTTASVTINALPVVSTPSASLCIGSTMTLSPTSGGTWVSSDPTIATVTNAGVVAGIASGSVTFTFTNTATTCSNTTSSVTINTLPSTPTGAGVTVCFDGAVHTGSATPGAGESIVWYTATSGGSVTTAPTGTAAGTYTAFAAAKNTTTGCESPTRTQVTVTINTLPTVTFTAGATAICTGSSSTYTTQAGQTNYVWSVTGGSITSGGTGADNTATIQWTSTGSVSVNYQDVNLCTAATPTSQAVTVDAFPTVAAAGSDQTNVCGTVSLGGNTPSSGTGSWGFAPGGNVDNLGSILTPNSPTSGFNGTPGQTYTLRWTISNGTCPSTSDDVAIGFDPAGVTPSAAGSDQNQCNNGSFTLAGNSPTSGTGTWTIVGSANGATITSPSLNNSAVAGLNLGTSVTLRWTISNGASCTSIDDVVLSNNDNPTSAAAGSDQSVCGTSTTLAGNTPTVGTGAWTITSGTGGSITSANNPSSVFTGTQGNSYTLRWTISNGACSPSFDDVVITFDKTPTTALAGPDILNACGTISLSANNPVVGVGQWTITSNPDNLGNVATPSSNLSNFNGSAGITYVLTWTVSNGSCPNSTDDVQIQYSPTGPTAANAGSDQNICGTSTTLLGNIPTVGTGQWSFASGGNPDGLGAFVDVNNQSSGFSGTEGQTYKLVWTISSGTCASIDQVTIQFGAPPTTSAAGTDQSSCTTSTTLAANTPSIGTGVWSFASGGNPDGLGAIANVNNSLSSFSGTAGQVYILTWTISSAGCSPSTDDVKITINNISLITFNQNYCQNAGTLDLTTLVSATPTGGTLTFTGTQVTGSNFDPTGLTGVQNISVKYDQNSCSVTKPLLINVLLPSNPACSGSGGGGGCSVPVISKQDVCKGTDGNIAITSVSGGTGTYQFSKDNGLNWSPLPSTLPFIFNNLAAGTYSVLVKDSNGCTSTVNTIVIVNKVTGSISKTDVTTCTSSDGTITFSNIQGGSGSYLYSIDGGTTFPYSTSPVTGLAAGTYSAVIKDNVTNGCISALTLITISGCITPPTLNCGVFTITATDTRPTCSGQDDGTITISVSGGTPNYVVTLSDPSQGFSQAMTGPGPFTFGAGPSGGLSPSLTYQYTIKDGAATPNTCTLPYSLPIQTNVLASAAGFVDAKCFNQAVGQATVTVSSGGTSPYEYSIDAGTTWISFTSPVTIANLMPALTPYSILVRDDATDLCPAQVSVTINNAVTDIITSFTATDASCSNNDGMIQVGVVSGGTGPYKYRFDSVDYVTLPANNTFTGLAGGTHKFTVIDANGCNKYFKTTINFPGLVNFTTIFNNPDCSGGGNNGNIIVTITSSGTFDVGITTDPVNDPAVFQTVVSSGGAQVTFNELSQGSYYAVAKPVGALCPSRSLPIAIGGGPVAVDFTIIPEDFICFETKGTVRITGIKGSSLVDYNYQIILKGNIIQSGTITQLQALPPDTINYTGLDKGNYQMILFQDQSAASGCTSPISSSYKSFSINGPTASLDTLYVNRAFSLPNIPTGSMLIGIQESQSPPYQLMLHLVNPHLPGQKNKQAFDSTWVSVSQNAQNLIMEFNAANIYGGDYRLSIRDTLGCTRTYDLSLDFDKDIIVPNVFTPNNDGKNDTFQVLNLPDDSKLVITNRWGKEVYQSSNYQNNWNGGSEVDGVYYYNLTAGGKTYTGWVEILHPSY